ncbi:hypothetical protein [Agaribacter marinus]|uniref:Uncharacterized protein n=1 Tax=Agaribacter marinus TaxID=1431249 RepID=A0AA37WJQ5_9ALTE|nr:hypothetical protein [Agaribacter marinus]GLR70100.1 hypothetical protein GCM10007852_10080 [Agaribacter marinus]
MTSIYVVVAILLQIIAIYSMKDGNSYTPKSARKITGYCVFVASTFFLVLAFGTLAGIFVSLALISLLGMLYPIIVEGRG